MDGEGSSTGNTGEPLHLRTISPDNSMDLNLRIADAIIAHVEAQAAARGYMTQEQADMLRAAQAGIRELMQNVDANMAYLNSVMRE